MHQLKSLPPGVFHPKSSFGQRVFHQGARCNPVSGQGFVKGGYVFGLHFEGVDPQVAQAGWVCRGDRQSAGVLPNLEATTAGHVQGQDRATPFGDAVGITGHEFGRPRIVKNRNPHIKNAAVPFPADVQIGHTDTGLLDTGEEGEGAHEGAGGLGKRGVRQG